MQNQKAFPSISEATCAECGITVKPIVRDFGYGTVEFWGDIVDASDYRVVCPECENEKFLDPASGEEIEIEVIWP